LKSEVYPLHFAVSYVQLVTQQYESKLFKKHLHNQSGHYENTDKFCYVKGSYHVLLPN